ALTLVDSDPTRARGLLNESIDRSSTPNAEIPTGFVTGCLVASRLEDWTLTLQLAARAMYLWRWTNSPLQAATCFAQCARAFGDTRPEVAGVLQGAAYTAFRRASPSQPGTRGSDTESAGSRVNFVLKALRETGEIVAAALGYQTLRKLRAEGAAMSMDE